MIIRKKKYGPMFCIVTDSQTLETFKNSRG